MTRSTPGRWTPDEDAELAKLSANGITPCAIAKQLRRPESSVYRRLETLAQQARRPGRRKRPCLCCKTPFMSEGPHNRLCGRCRGKELSPFDF